MYGGAALKARRRCSYNGNRSATRVSRTNCTMRNSTSKAPTALSTAVAAWNNKAREISAPVLRHIFATIRNLQRLRSGIRHFGSVNEADLINEEVGPVDALRELCTRLDDFEQSLADLSQQAHAVTQQGESLIQDYLALSLHGKGTGEVPTLGFQIHVANWAEGGAERLLEADVRALDHLIEKQKAEIDALNRQLSDAEYWLTERAPSPPEAAPRACGQIELQSVQEFVQNSPIASIPINASYYERILEAASTNEPHNNSSHREINGTGTSARSVYRPN